jgi:hypothetical protein
MCWDMHQQEFPDLPVWACERWLLARKSGACSPHNECNACAAFGPDPSCCCPCPLLLLLLLQLVAAHGPELTVGLLDEMHYAEAVIKEVLRVAPPSGTVLRRTLADMEVGWSGGGLSWLTRGLTTTQAA